MYLAVFLDRDNTIIHNDGDLGDPEQVKLIQGAASAIASLRGLGYKIVVVSNQGGVARGKYTEADVDAVNRRISDLVKRQSGALIDRFYYCPYHPEAVVDEYRREHPWRKPQPGMLLQAAMDMNLDLRQSWTIGDQLRDVEAGKAASTRTILLRDPSQSGEQPSGAQFIAGTLSEAVRLIGEQHKVASGATDSSSGPAPYATEFSAGPAAGGTESGDSPAGSESASPTSEAEPEPLFEPTIQPAAVALERPHSPPSMKEVPTLFTPQTPERSPTITPDSPTKTPESPKRPDVPTASVTPPKPRIGRTEPVDSSDMGEPRDSQAQLLSQILRELKQSRLHHNDFSWSKLAAVLLQTLTIGCVLFAIFAFADKDSFSYFEWMMGAIFGQLAVIAALLNARRSG